MRWPWGRKKQPQGQQLSMTLEELETMPSAAFHAGRITSGMTLPVGYMISHPRGLIGVQGIGYDYVIGHDGLYVQARSENLTARTPCGNRTMVKGLCAVTPKMELAHGPINGKTIDHMVNWLCEDPRNEAYSDLTFNEGAGGYGFTTPLQVATGASVTYHPSPRAVLQMHSHAAMPAFFSSMDNRDEQGFALYAVVGHANRPPEQRTFALRIGIYGHFFYLEQDPEIFAGLFDPLPQILITARSMTDVPD